MISPIQFQPNWGLDEPTAPAGVRSVSGMDSETEITEWLAHESAKVVTDNKDPAGSYLVGPEGIGRDSHTRPFNDGLILYNGHAGLGESTAVCVPGKPEIPNLTDDPSLHNKCKGFGPDLLPASIRQAGAQQLEMES